eukprot:jgi/Mesen1/9804/ME000007S09863
MLVLLDSVGHPYTSAAVVERLDNRRVRTSDRIEVRLEGNVHLDHTVANGFSREQQHSGACSLPPHPGRVALAQPGTQLATRLPLTASRQATGSPAEDEDHHEQLLAPGGHEGGGEAPPGSTFPPGRTGAGEAPESSFSRTKGAAREGGEPHAAGPWRASEAREPVGGRRSPPQANAYPAATLLAPLEGDAGQSVGGLKGRGGTHWREEEPHPHAEESAAGLQADEDVGEAQAQARFTSEQLASSDGGAAGVSCRAPPPCSAADDRDGGEPGSRLRQPPVLAAASAQQALTGDTALPPHSSRCGDKGTRSPSPGPAGVSDDLRDGAAAGEGEREAEAGQAVPKAAAGVPPGAAAGRGVGPGAGAPAPARAPGVAAAAAVAAAATEAEATACVRPGPGLSPPGWMVPLDEEQAAGSEQRGGTERGGAGGHDEASRMLPAAAAAAAVQPLLKRQQQQQQQAARNSSTAVAAEEGNGENHVVTADGAGGGHLAGATAAAVVPAVGPAVLRQEGQGGAQRRQEQGGYAMQEGQGAQGEGQQGEGDNDDRAAAAAAVESERSIIHETRSRAGSRRLTVAASAAAAAAAATGGRGSAAAAAAAAAATADDDHEEAEAEAGAAKSTLEEHGDCAEGASVGPAISHAQAQPQPRGRRGHGRQPLEVVNLTPQQEEPNLTPPKGRRGTGASSSRKRAAGAADADVDPEADAARPLHPPPQKTPMATVKEEQLACAYGLKMSRKGRPIVPVLAYWRNQSLLRDKDGGIIGIIEGSPEGTAVGSGMFSFRFDSASELEGKLAARGLDTRLFDAVVKKEPASAMEATPQGEKGRKRKASGTATVSRRAAPHRGVSAGIPASARKRKGGHRASEEDGPASSSRSYRSSRSARSRGGDSQEEEEGTGSWQSGSEMGGTAAAAAAEQQEEQEQEEEEEEALEGLNPRMRPLQDSLRARKKMKCSRNADDDSCDADDEEPEEPEQDEEAGEADHEEEQEQEEPEEEVEVESESKQEQEKAAAKMDATVLEAEAEAEEAEEVEEEEEQEEEEEDEDYKSQDDEEEAEEMEERDEMQHEGAGKPEELGLAIPWWARDVVSKGRLRPRAGREAARPKEEQSGSSGQDATRAAGAAVAPMSPFGRVTPSKWQRRPLVRESGEDEEGGKQEKDADVEFAGERVGDAAAAEKKAADEEAGQEWLMLAPDKPGGTGEVAKYRRRMGGGSGSKEGACDGAEYLKAEYNLEESKEEEEEEVVHPQEEYGEGEGEGGSAGALQHSEQRKESRKEKRKKKRLVKLSRAAKVMPELAGEAAVPLDVLDDDDCEVEEKEERPGEECAVAGEGTADQQGTRGKELTALNIYSKPAAENDVAAAAATAAVAAAVTVAEQLATAAAATAAAAAATVAGLDVLEGTGGMRAAPQVAPGALDLVQASVVAIATLGPTRQAGAARESQQ